ncbi:hypothetical protein E4U43_000594 [Claviceps pusilla]|uniref:Methyltransferase n=1 Tax=Claviceps pusilla TaxID=123648 RepID=A0A9P7SYZ0_9HYPO|nr:hypothetical protein E4U43_000594 [Claviceps pusilla]
MLKDTGYPKSGPSPHAAREALKRFDNGKSEHDQHSLYLSITGGKVGVAPVTKPRRVLDVGTGTGVWAYDYASANPSSHVTGIDLFDIQRPFSLPNLTFHQVDVEKDDFPGGPDQKYDYIFLRYIISCFDSTQAVFRRAFEHLAPGGWIEIFDPCQNYLPVGGLVGETALEKWTSLSAEGGRRMGRDLYKARSYATWLREAGFVNVTEMKIGAPFHAGTFSEGTRVREISEKMSKMEVKAVLLLGKMLRQVVPDEDEARALEEGAQRDIQNPDLNFVKEMFNVYAQKPKDA